MRSRHCTLMELHEDDFQKTREFHPGFAHSSTIRYSPHRLKSHRRLDTAIREEDLEEMKLKHRLQSPLADTCTTC